MLSRQVFEKGLAEIEEVFINFEMTKERADIWYKYSKHMEDNEWEKKISNCIKGCHRIPTLADILDIKGYYRDDPEPPHSKKFYEEEEYERGKQPEEAKKNMHELYKKIGYISKLREKYE